MRGVWRNILTSCAINYVEIVSENIDFESYYVNCPQNVDMQRND